MFAPAQLGNVWLSSVRFDENEDFTPPEAALTFEVDQEVEIEAYEQGGEGRGTSATLRLDLEVLWWEGEESAAEPPFRISLTIRGTFNWFEVPDEQIARTWLEYNGPYLLWPYARSYVATITGLGRLPALTLYTLQVPELPDLESSEENAVPGAAFRLDPRRSSEPV